MTPLKAIRAKCIDCSGGSVYEPKYCTVKHCPLWPYRDGHDPAKKGKGNTASLKALNEERARLKRVPNANEQQKQG